MKEGILENFGVACRAFFARERNILDERGKQGLDFKEAQKFVSRYQQLQKLEEAVTTFLKAEENVCAYSPEVTPNREEEEEEEHEREVSSEAAYSSSISSSQEGEEEEEEEGDDEWWEQEERRRLKKLLKDVGGKRSRTHGTTVNYSAEVDLEQFWKGDDGVGVETLFDTQYGKTLYDRVMQIALATGYHTPTSCVKEHFTELLTSTMDVEIEKAPSYASMKCYLCNGAHVCAYDIVFTDNMGEKKREPLGATCQPVAQAVLKLTRQILLGPWRQNRLDYTRYHEDVEAAFDALQEIHLNKNKKKRKTWG